MHAGSQHSSLFVLYVSDEEKSFITFYFSFQTLALQHNLFFFAQNPTGITQLLNIPINLRNQVKNT